MNIPINFEDVYDIEYISPDFRKFSFSTPITNGNPITLYVEIENAANPFLHEFLNLCFGPYNEHGKIDDLATVKHLNHAKSFSTILFCGLIFLRANPQAYIGIDGSDNRRAYLYFRIIQKNYTYLNDYFNLYGVRYYIRLMRPQKRGDPMEGDINEVISLPFTIDNQPLTNQKSLFNYFLFNLKPNNL